MKSYQRFLSQNAGFDLYWLKKDKQKIEETINCPECGNSQINKDYSRAELVCKNCGLVIDAEIIDHSPEWRAFNNEQQEKRARVGAPMTYTRHDKGLSTILW